MDRSRLTNPYPQARPRRSRKAWVASGLTALLVGCAPAPLAPAPTATAPSTPSPSATPASVDSPSLLPLVNVTPFLVLEPPELIPSATPTLLSLPLPPEKLILEAPGPGSQLGSPVHVVGWGGPSSRDLVRLRLLGEDGRVLAQLRTYLLVLPGRSGRFIADLAFQIPGVAEVALLEASYDNPLTGRLDHLTTRQLILLTTGRPLLQPVVAAPEKVSLFTPREDRVITGGSILIRGAAWLDEEGPLLVELLDRQGNLLSSAEVELAAPAPGQLGTFEVTLPYSVPRAQYGWVAVSERSQKFATLLHYTSLRVYLRP